MSDSRIFPEGAGKSSADVDTFLEELGADQHAVEVKRLDDAKVGGQSGNSSESSGDASTMDTAAAKGKEALSTAKDKATDVSDQAKDKVADVSSQAHAKADEGMNKAAEGVNQAADMLRQRGEQSGGSMGTAATTVADKLDSAGSYLQEKNTDQILQDIEALIRRKPVESLLVAAGAGFVLSKLFS